MQITTQCSEDRCIIRIKGDLRGRDVALLTRAVRESHHSLVAVDLKDVTFIDSCGIGSLIYSHQLLKTQTRQMVVTSPPEFVKNILNDFASSELIEEESLPYAS